MTSTPREETYQLPQLEEMLHHHNARTNDNLRDIRFIGIQHSNHSNSETIPCLRGSNDPSNQPIRARLRLWPNNLRTTLRILRAEATDVPGHICLRNLLDSRRSSPEPPDNLHMSLSGRDTCQCASCHCESSSFGIPVTMLLLTSVIWGRCRVLWPICLSQ